MNCQVIKTKREGLIQITTLDERWYLRQSDEKLFKSATWVAGCYPKGIGFYKWLAEHGWDEAETIKREAGERGSKVHQAIDALIQGKTVRHDDFLTNPTTGMPEQLTPDEYWTLTTFLDWWKETKPVTICTEMTVYNDEFSTAGTMDWKGKLGDQIVPWILDWKTSQQIWTAHEIQMSILRHCEANSPEVNGPVRTAILQVGYRKNKAGWKFTEIEDKMGLWMVAEEIWRVEHGKETPKQYEFPDSITLPASSISDAFQEKSETIKEVKLKILKGEKHGTPKPVQQDLPQS